VSATDRSRTRWAHLLSFRNVSALYLLIALFVLYSFWVGDTFLTSTTLKSLLVEQSVTAMAAIALVIPLAAGAIDLSIAMVLGTGSVVVAWLMGDHGWAMVPAIVATLAVGLAIGAINALSVVRFRINSLIATLAMFSILTALGNALTNGDQLIGLTPAFQDLASTEIAGIGMPVFYLLIVALIVWYVLEHTPVGRRVYATGGNTEAARLAGVKTGRIVAGAFVAAAIVATLAGMLATARAGSATSTSGVGYLLPVFAGAFLGATQFRGGQFNVWGTVLAVYVLAVGVKGLELAGAPYWLPDLFNGVALLIAVGLANVQTRLRSKESERDVERADAGTGAPMAAAAADAPHSGVVSGNG
jgi:ribose transport system permease protein